VVYEEEGANHEVAADSSVSMNCWCFHHSVFNFSEKLFKEFIATQASNLKSEFFIPIIADHFIKQENNKIKVIPTSSNWFGVTYKEDAPGVKKSIDDLIAAGIYPEKLW